jgi:hypothetical protein
MLSTKISQTLTTTSMRKPPISDNNHVLNSNTIVVKEITSIRTVISKIILLQPLIITTTIVLSMIEGATSQTLNEMAATTIEGIEISMITVIRNRQIKQ